MNPHLLRGIGCLTVLASLAAPSAPRETATILDRTHYSYVFGEQRNYRIFLPPGYDQAAEKRYPVIYFFHGWGQRYNSPGDEPRDYDAGEDYGGDTIAAFVARHDVIVVKWDGYDPRHPGENYRRPYNIGPVETYRQFPLYFPELVSYIDATYRTIADRDHRATAGLSMGGFMSYWVAGKYPHLVGSASNFMGASEFFAGPNGFPSEYRHTEMYPNYEGLRTRIVLGSRDFIRWYHRRMNAVWDYTRPHHEHEEFDSTHGTPGMAKTLNFHMESFRDPLPNPSLWHHIDVYPEFTVWGYSVSTDRRRPGFTVLENVSPDGFRSSVREWLPDGKVLSHVTVRVTTDSLYQAGAPYRITEVNLDTGEVRRTRQQADSTGRLHFLFNGSVHEVGITSEAKPVLTVAGWRVAGAPWATNGQPVRVEFDVLNKGSARAKSPTIEVSLPNPGVEIKHGRLEVRDLDPGESAPSSRTVEFVAQDPERRVVKLQVRIGETRVPVVIPLHPDAPELSEALVLDGGVRHYWDHAVNEVDKTLGTGNADGAANPGETIAIGLRDGAAIRAAEVFTNEACVTPVERLSDYWGEYDIVGASAKISLLQISAGCPEGHQVPLFVRFQLPHKPEHVLKEGVVRLRVTGRDTTPPRVLWARTGPWNRLEAEIRDGAGVRSARATLRKDDAVLKVPLNDEGRDGDRTAGDSVFSGLLPNPAPGPYRLTIHTEDRRGNSSETTMDSDFQFTLPPPAPVMVIP